MEEAFSSSEKYVHRVDDFHSNLSQDSPAAEDTSRNARCSDDIASCHKNSVCPMVGSLRDKILVDENVSILQHPGAGFLG